MAPKRGCSTVGAPVMKKKRTVRRPARQPSPSSDSTDSISIPSATPGPSSPPVDSLAGRVITMGRKVDFNFLDSEGFALSGQLRRMGWESVCSLDLPTYPALVKKFYSNLARGDGGLVSTVRGTRIHITFEILGNVVSCPVEGVSANAHENRGAALSRMLGREVSEIEEIQANQLPLELRLLHNICSRVLFPKTGRFEYVSERDVIVMDSVISGHPINLPGMMIWHMAEAASKKRATLPYGMILTKIFQSQNVVILDSEPKKLLRHTDYYNRATLHRMGFTKKNGRWMRKGNQEVETENIGASGVSPSEGEPSARRTSPGPSGPMPAMPPPVPEPSTDFSEAQLSQIRSLLSGFKDELRIEFNRNIVGLDAKVDAIKTDLASSFVDLKEDLESKFDDLNESICTMKLTDKLSDVSASFEKKFEELKKSVEELKKKNDM